MITPSAEKQNVTRKPPRNRPARETGPTPERRARRNLRNTAATDHTDVVQSLKHELDTVRREHAEVQQAIYEAAQVQRRLCAPRDFDWGEFEISGEIFPVRHLSGDFFKVMELDSVLGLTVGDIAGKGLSAGIWQAHLIDLIQRCARTHVHPADAAAGVNRELCQDQSEPPITALFFARLDPQRNELVYCNAGLPAPLLLRRNGSLERLEKGGPMLGALKEARYNSESVRLNPGDMLLAYSDGLTECRNSQEEEFEMERLSAAAKAVSGATANQVLFSTLGAVLDFADGCPPGDDLTLLVVRRCEARMTGHISADNKDFSRPRRSPASAVRPRQVVSGEEAFIES
ncbi:MAG TPA: PP2C family protein-serine/threonine phosphatase [Candidatus Acidoferrales bacterium]|nr:PP2C family protein-serine/threonine phosphatase [Candidatus Acidoferrales bacterium]